MGTRTQFPDPGESIKTGGDGMVLVQQEILNRNGYDIGIGIDMATGSPMTLGAQGVVTPPQFGTGESGVFMFRRIDTTDDLEEALHVGAEASGGIGLFSASASFDFAKSCKVQSSSLVVMISAELRFPFEQLDEPELTKNAADFVEANKPLGPRFGDYFVRGVVSGGRYFGVLRIDTNSAEGKSTIDAALSGSYGLAVSGEVKTQLSSTIRKFSSRTEAFVKFDGGEVRTVPRSNDPTQVLDELFKSMDEWQNSVRNKPAQYLVAVAPYAIADGPEPPNLADLENQRDVLKRCARLRSQTLDKLNLVDYILDPNRMDEFDIVAPPDGPDLPALQAALSGDLDVIADAASFSINNIKKACDPVTFMRTVEGVSTFTLTPLPLNMPKKKSQSEAVTPGQVALTGGPFSFDGGRAQLIFDVPERFQATLEMAVNWGDPTMAAGVVRSAGVVVGRDGQGSGQALGRDANGVAVCRAHWHKTDGAITFADGGQPYPSDKVFFRFTRDGLSNPIEFSQNGIDFTRTPGVKMLGKAVDESQPLKLILFAWSKDAGSVNVRFSRPQIVPI